VEVDRYTAQHQSSWDRLARLVDKPRKVAPHEIDELIRLYQHTAAHLSYARSTLRDPALVARLTPLVADANAVIYGQPRKGRNGLAVFVARTFPAAMWRLRHQLLVAAVLLFVPAVAMGAWIATSDRARDASAPEAVREAYINEDFESYYSSDPAGQFASQVFFNNVRVSMLAFATGILFCVVTAGLMIYNGANIGMAGGLFADVGELDKFFGLILPHGLLELSGVVMAGGAGLHIGWALIAPGDRPRGTAVIEAGRRAFTVLIGTVAVLFVAGFIEGFITGRGYSTAMRVTIGALPFAAFWLYVIANGRRVVTPDAT
jgi:uncharacterized membrane protein SpoIIM required for sporulation